MANNEEFRKIADNEELNKITLNTVDGVTFEVDSVIAKELKTVKAFLDERDSGDSSIVNIPLPNIYSRELSKIIEYCNHHCRFRSGKAPEATVKEFHTEFVKAMSHEELKEMVLAANFLEYKELLDFMFQTIADFIQNKSVEFVRKFFGIVNDFSPEEEAKLREEIAWAFEGVDADPVD